MSLFADIALIAELQGALKALPDSQIGDGDARRAGYCDGALAALPASESAEFREADRCAVVAETARRLVVAAGGNRRIHDRRL